MHLGFTASLQFCCCIQNGDHIHFLVTTGILVVGTKGAIQRHLHLWLLLVHMAVAHLGNVVEDVAPVALEDVQVGPHLPIDFSPRNSVSLSDEGYKLFEVPRPVYNMLGSNLAVIINIRLSLAAVEHLALTHGE